MNKYRDPRDVVIALMTRSVCSVQVAALLVDEYGIHSWGWNNEGATGYGEHAEAMCLRRANRRRLGKSTLYVAAQRKRNGKPVTGRPCVWCQPLIKEVKHIMYRNALGGWVYLK